MSLTAFAIRNNRVTGVVIAVLVFAGVVAYQNMPKQMDPGFIIRAAQIVTYFPGASPERVEQLLSDPIEKVVQEIPELDAVQSVSRNGVSVVIVSIREEFKDMRPIWDDLRRKIDGIRGNLPSGIVGPNVNDGLGDTYPILYSMTGDGFSYREMKEIADLVRDDLLHLPNVAKVDILGAQEERLFVEYNNARLAQLGLSQSSLQQILQSRNIIMPGGQVDVGRETIVLEPSGNFVSVEDLERTLVKLPSGELSYLGDITSIRRGYVDPPNSIVHVDGTPGLTLALSMAKGGNLIEVGEHAAAFFDSLPDQYPHGIDFYRTYFQPKDVATKISEFTSNVLQAIGIVLIVMLISLGLRTGLVVASLIPTTIVITLFVMSVFGVSIDQMSLAALIIALGLLVDNAIVVSESVMVRMGEGEKAFEAAVGACRELQVPLLVSSLTTAASFLPIYLAESAVGEYCGVLFVVVSITLLVSWFVALTLIPLLCTRFLKVKQTKKEDAYNNAFYRGYRRTLAAVIGHPYISLGVVIVTFFGSMQLFAFVPAMFFPSQSNAFFMAEFTLPPGTSIHTTTDMVEDIEHFMGNEINATEDRSGITHWTSFIGTTPPPFVLGYTPSPSRSGYSELMVTTNSGETVTNVMKQLQDYAEDAFPDAKTNIRALGNGPGGGTPVQIRLLGADLDRVFANADDVKAKLQSLAGTRNITDDWGPRVKKMRVDISEERARRAGLTNQDIALSLQTFLSGFTVSSFREDDQTIPVVLRSVATNRRDVDRLKTLNVFSQVTGQSVPLTQVADLSLEWQPAEILRRNRYRTVTVSSELVDGVTATDINEQLGPWLDEQKKAWGPGYNFEIGGEIESSGKANASIGAKLPIALLVIIMLLVWQFNSVRKTTIVLSTIVLAMIGVVLGLLIMRSYFGFMTLLGIISLAGIVINNAIVLLDRIDIEIHENGMPPAEGILQAAQSRVRPILLTTVTTVASLIPLYLGGGAMWEPMAVAIMFGLVFATVLTLGVVPLLYTVFYRIQPTPAAPTPAAPTETPQAVPVEA